MKYCHNCDWTATRADESDAARSRAAVEHFVETGHSVGTVFRAGAPDAGALGGAAGDVGSDPPVGEESP